MAKKKTKSKTKSKTKKEKKLKLGTFKETAREKLIGQHIGYRYDVNLLPDYKKITPFLRKYVEAMGWDDLNWLEVCIWVMKKGDQLYFVEMQMVGLQFLNQLNYQIINKIEI